MEETRRQGLKLALLGRLDKLSLSARYGFLDASFESPITINSPNNSSADANGDIRVRPSIASRASPPHL